MDLEGAAQEVNQSPVAEPAPLELIMGRARSRRRRRWLTGSAGGLAAAIVLIVALMAPGGGSGQEVVATSPSTTTAPSTARLLDPPATFVAHLRQVGNAAAPIVVMRTGDGAMLRVLGADYDPYVGNGFHTSERAVYWQHLDEPAQRFPVTELRLSDGATRTVAEGSLNMPSPDGSRLLVGNGGTFVLNLRDLTRHDLPEPDLDGQRLTTLSWLPDGKTVLAASSDFHEARGDCGVMRCPIGATTAITQPPRPPRGWTLDTSAPSAVWRALPDSPAWANLQILGPGRLPNTVAAAQVIGGSSTIITLNTDGLIVDRLPEAPDSVLAVDHTGTNFLVQHNDQLARTALADPTLIPIGPTVAEASWW